jgi:FMN-dependent NADH-azoreductase
LVNSCLNFFGIKKIDIIAADQMALDYEKSIKKQKSKLKNKNMNE